MSELQPNSRLADHDDGDIPNQAGSKLISSITLILACFVELGCWIACGAILYWRIPVSAAAFDRAGVEIPSSMLRVIVITDWMVTWWGISLPLLLILILVPKLCVFATTTSAYLRMAWASIGWGIPILLALYGAGLPKLHKLGLWP